MMRTLVVHAGGIGDFLLTCPAIAKLAEEGPVEVAGHRDRLELAVTAGIAEAAHALDSVDFSSTFAEPSATFTQFVQRFSRAIVWMRDEDGRIRSGLTACGVPDVRAYAGLPPEDWNRHASAYYLKCLGFPPEAAPFRFAIPPTMYYDVVIHPGSGGTRKNWPMERFIALAEAVEAQGYEVIWCAGPAEEPLPIPAGRRIHAESLVGLAGQLAGARLYVGNDSGITHLAAAVGTSTIAIFGPTNPRVWAPLGKHVRVVCGEPWPEMADLLAAAVAAQR